MSATQGHRCQCLDTRNRGDGSTSLPCEHPAPCTYPSYPSACLANHPHMCVGRSTGDGSGASHATCRVTPSAHGCCAAHPAAAPPWAAWGCVPLLKIARAGAAKACVCVDKPPCRGWSCGFFSADRPTRKGICPLGGNPKGICPLDGTGEARDRSGTSIAPCSKTNARDRPLTPSD